MNADLSATLRDIPSSELLAWLSRRRWFGAKGRHLADARITTVVALPFGDAPSAIAVVDVRDESDRVDRYQLPLALVPSAPNGAEPLARSEAGVIVDASLHPPFLKALGESLRRGAAFGDDQGRWVIEPVSASERDAGPAKVGDAEQSNTSVRYGDETILKLIRRLEPGEHPEVEMASYLTTRAHFPHTPELRATIWLRDSAGAAVAGIEQALVPGARDAWSWALEEGKAIVAGADDAEFIAAAKALGAATAELHAALAKGEDADFTPERANADMVASWAEAARKSVASGLELLERRKTSLAGTAAELASALRDPHSATRTIDDLVRRIGDDGGLAIRHHGDYHLGQVLRSSAGRFYIIDFEGEPAKSLAERRALSSGLRDVAGMLRSFAYAAATVAMDANDTTRQRATTWERDARQAFRDGYFAVATMADFLPSTSERTSALVSLFELEKVFYELAYELNNRPDWAWIPMTGIRRLLESSR